MPDAPVWALPPGGPRRLNVAVLGDTGVGKSSLINAALGDDVATVGSGAPVLLGPDGAQYHTRADSELGFWDFEGFHHGAKVAPAKRLTRQLTAIARGIPVRRIDVAWFCWQASSARLTEGHRRLLAVLRQFEIPTLGVLTKVHADGDAVSTEHSRFATWLEAEGIGLAGGRVFLTATVGDEALGLVAHGIEPLLDATRQVATRRP